MYGAVLSADKSVYEYPGDTELHLVWDVDQSKLVRLLHPKSLCTSCVEPRSMQTSTGVFAALATRNCTDLGREPV